MISHRFRSLIVFCFFVTLSFLRIKKCTVVIHEKTHKIVCNHVIFKHDKHLLPLNCFSCVDEDDAVHGVLHPNKLNNSVQLDILRPQPNIYSIIIKQSQRTYQKLQTELNIHTVFNQCFNPDFYDLQREQTFV